MEQLNGKEDLFKKILKDLAQSKPGKISLRSKDSEISRDESWRREVLED